MVVIKMDFLIRGIANFLIGAGLHMVGPKLSSLNFAHIHIASRLLQGRYSVE